MSPEEQRIFIAEACGWVRRPDLDYHTYPDVKREIWAKDGRCTHELPDFCADLNAMAQAEAMLEQYAPYAIELRRIVWMDCGGENPRYESASAFQRATAFCRVLQTRKGE